MVKKLIVGGVGGSLAFLAAVVLLFHRTGSRRLIVAIVLQLIAMAVVMAMIERPGERKPLTWSRAMAGGVLTVGVLLLAFGSVPHEWITFGDSFLKWGRNDLIVWHTPVGIVISRQAIRDLIEAGVYTNNFVALCAIWLLWQERFKLADEKAQRASEREKKEPVPSGTSAFGRPLAKQG